MAHRVLPLLFLCCCTDSLVAAVHDRGGGLLYDDVLKITWLQDANYAKSVKAPQATAQGELNWDAANAWVEGLIYHDSVRNVDWDDWRLPRVRPLAESGFSGRFRLDGSSDEGYNIVSPRSELAYMFHVNLGCRGYYRADGQERQDFGAGGNGKWGGSHDVGPVRNLMAVIYWTGTNEVLNPERNAWMFDTYWGFQNFYNKWDKLYVWPVRDGDVAVDAPTR